MSSSKRAFCCVCLLRLCLRLSLPGDQPIASLTPNEDEEDVDDGNYGNGDDVDG